MKDLRKDLGNFFKLPSFLRSWIRSLIPTWRFFDQPDFVWEIQIDQAPWVRLVEMSPFRFRHLLFDPESIELAWIDNQLRRVVEQPNESYSSLWFRALGDRYCCTRGIAVGRDYAFRARDIFDKSIVVSISSGETQEL